MNAATRSSFAPRSSVRPLALLALAATGGCATINPTLAPARVLAPNQVAAELGGGYAAPAVAPPLSDALAAQHHVATAPPGTPVSQSDRDALLRGAAAFGGTPPGLAPYVSVRAGFGGRVEAQLALIGRAGRIGVRRVFWTDADEVWALSLGVQGRIAPYANGDAGVVPGLSVDSSRLYGGDFSAVLGRSSRGLYDVWIGVRAGYTHGDGTFHYDDLDAGTHFGAELERLDVAATVGIRVGFGHISAAAEIETDVGFYWGSTSTAVTSNGTVLSLVPAFALGYSF